MHCDRIWRNAHLATLAPDREGLGTVERGLIASHGGTIVYAGPQREAPAHLTAPNDVDCQGRLITPGFIDCHTHLVYARNRAHALEHRLNGVSYEDLARRGGGILSTVDATRA